MKETRTVVLDNLAKAKKHHAHLRRLRGIADGRIKLKMDGYSSSRG